MNAAMKLVEGRYFQDIMDQPRALDATLAWLGQDGKWNEACRFLQARSWKRIVLTGMGSSYHALHPLNLSLIESGYSPVMMETSELIHYGLRLCDGDTLIILVSQSGRSAEILRLLDLNGHSAVLGITNTADSRLAASSNLALLTQAGPEFSVSCKTYMSGMLALQWLGAVFAGKDERSTLDRFAPLNALVERYLKDWPSHVRAIATQLQDIEHLFLTGRGGSLAAVGTGGLIIKESAHFHSEGMSSAAFRHGPMEMLQPDMFTLVFSGSDKTRQLNRSLLHDLRARNCLCEELGNEAGFAPFRLPESDPMLQPILEILPVEMITLALAALAGREAGYFEHGSKVTETE